jgi:hypothetical protein
MMRRLSPFENARGFVVPWADAAAVKDDNTTAKMAVRTIKADWVLIGCSSC